MCVCVCVCVRACVCIMSPHYNTFYKMNKFETLLKFDVILAIRTDICQFACSGGFSLKQRNLQSRKYRKKWEFLPVSYQILNFGL